VLLQFHSPLRVAESFRALEAVYPDRIDMGLSAGLTGDDFTRQALSEKFHPEIARITHLYARKVEQLLMLSRNQYPPNHRFARGPTPIGQKSPPAWLLGGGPGIGNMILAAQFGTSFCYSLVHGNPARGVATVQEYRDRFQASEELQSHVVTIALSVLCAETEPEVERIRARFQAWQSDPVITVAGTPRQCRERILEISARYSCGEVILIPAFDRLSDRARSYVLLAEEFGLCQSALPDKTWS
jgi:alkanesulfonate monooxygenase SsuD/methylene tetrahydromethanopterin reductase-like flavin-dependent oxidoreductase (luciferase family)